MPHILSSLEYCHSLRIQLLEFFELKFFLSNGNFDLENPYTRYGGEYFTMEFIPEITGIEIINESKVIINWEDNSGFEDGFQI